MTISSSGGDGCSGGGGGGGGGGIWANVAPSIQYSCLTWIYLKFKLVFNLLIW